MLSIQLLLIIMILCIMTQTSSAAFGEVNANFARMAVVHLYTAVYAGNHIGASTPNEEIVKILKRGKLIGEEALKI